MKAHPYNFQKSTITNPKKKHSNHQTANKHTKKKYHNSLAARITRISHTTVHRQDKSPDFSPLIGP